MPEETITVPTIIRSNRLIGHLKGQDKGPTIFFFGGIHGNEKAGVVAIEKVFEQLQSMTETLSGSVIGIQGNTPALFQNKRFLDTDLNRLWTTKNIDRIKSKQESELGIEEKELLGIHDLIISLLNAQSPPFYFIDLHTTSSKTLPFVTINDALINRNFAKLFPVPIILGIEEFLEGPLLSYMNEKGYVSLGFESGQHEVISAVDNAVAFIWLTLVNTGALPKNEIPFFKPHFEQLENAAKGNSTFYEVEQRFALSKNDEFIMYPGFESFQKVKKGTILGVNNDIKVETPKSSQLFMPLYQKQGAEAFFLIREIPKWILKISEVLRKIKADNLLVALPGIKWNDSGRGSLKVNLKIARFYAKSLFHLLGYRNRTIDSTHIIIQNRERNARNDMYRNEPWF
ncbi:succinylglutamate desuccinylase/aspartoacylase family protein [Maribacter algicola]|uniref:Succinylglutamate desuccinylase/aspartoacylase family protein n=1 Tax=Meishania litoralis TaxID=3434685 RepID=A0ACC7LNJ3_9FLAO